MKFVVNNNFQWKGLHKAEAILTVPASMVADEIEKGKHPEKFRGKERWMSGLLEHCTPANKETADFIEEKTGELLPTPDPGDDDESDAKEIVAIRAEFDGMGKAYNKKLGLKKLREALIVAKRGYAEPQEQKPKTENIK